MVFVRDVEKFRDAIERHDTPKELVYDQIILESPSWAGGKTSDHYVSMALALLLKGEAGENTKQIIDKALFLDPNNVMAHYCDALYSLIVRRNAKKAGS
jgi:hypothetical protein